jgi:hypothetical protein
MKKASKASAKLCHCHEAASWRCWQDSLSQLKTDLQPKSAEQIKQEQRATTF